MKYSRLLLAIVMPVVLLLLFMVALQTNASPSATFTVNSTTDAVDADPGDGVCESAEGMCTLRAAVMEANAQAGSDIISLPANVYALTIAGQEEDAGASGDIDILDDLTINGAGATTTIVNGSSLDRVFNITGTNNSTVSISNLTIQNGGFDMSSNVAEPHGGGIHNPLPGASVLISDSIFLNNQAFGSSLTGRGGGIYNAGSLQISNTDFFTNTSPGGHGLYNSGSLSIAEGNLAFNNIVAAGPGGTIYNEGTLFVDGTAFYNNFSYAGGGLHNSPSGTATLENVEIYSNTVYLDGGGVFNFGTITVTNSAIYSNKTNSSSGGGIYNFRGNFNVISSTIHHNTAVVGFATGGGVYLNEGVLTIKNTNVFSNSAGAGGGIYNNNGELLLLNGSDISDNAANTLGGGIYSLKPVSLESSIIANNHAQTGGGLYIDGNVLTVTASTIHNNQANDAAGIGLYNFSLMNMQNSTVSYNSAITEGGGILIDLNSTSLVAASTIYSNSATIGGGILNYGQLDSINSTVSSNMASQQGGGVWSEASNGTFLKNVTLTENDASSGAGIFRSNLTTLSITNTLIANNGVENCNLPLTSTYFSLEDRNDCGLVNTGDITNTNPLLDTLTDNGGATMTHALLTGSPAIDAGDNVNCPSTDQRGVARPFDGDDDGTAVCDIGAVEYGATSLQYIFLPQIMKP